MAAPAPDAPAPPEGVWAHPRPPAGVPNLRNQFSNSSNGLASVPQPLLSGRRSEPGATNLGGSAPIGGEVLADANKAQDSSASATTMRQPPLSARERGSSQQQKPRVRGRRSQSADDQLDPTRGAAAAGGSPSRRVKRTGRSASNDGNETFMRLLNDIIGSNLSEPAIARLEFEAGPSRRLQEVAKLLRSLQSQIQSGSGVPPIAQPQDGDLGQMMAQVAFLEKKILKLREKLKKKTMEATNRADSIGRAPRKPQGSKLDLHDANMEELMAELSALRSEKAALDSERTAASPPPRSPGRMSVMRHSNAPMQERDESQTVVTLKRRFNGLQVRIKDLTSEKDAADANAEVARGLAEKVEGHLRETALTRESERIKLEAEHELLRRRIEEQNVQIAQFEGMAVNLGELDELRARIAEAESELASLRRAQDGGQAHDSFKPSTPGGHGKPATPKTGPTQEEYERLVRSCEEARAECARLTSEFNDAETLDAACIRGLEEELARVRKDGQRAEYQRRRQLADVMEQRQVDLEAEAEAHHTALQGGGSQALVDARNKLEASVAQFNTSLEAEQAGVAANLKHMETQMNYVQSEMIQNLDKQKMQAQRQSDLRSRCYLALRPQKYQRDEVLQYLSCALNLPLKCFQVLEEVRVPEKTTCRGLVQAVGEPVPPPQDKLDMYVRPLRETRPPPQDADEHAGKETSGETHQASRANASEAALDAMEPPEGSLIRLTINFLRDSKSNSATGDSTSEHAALVSRLSTLVANGGTLLEDMAVVSVCSLLGSSPLHDNSEPGELVARLKRSIAGRNFLITAHRTLEPLCLKLIAIDHAGDEGFVLCFDDGDLRTLLGGQSALLQQPELGREMLETLLDTLHVINITDGKPVLASIHAVPAPCTVLNSQPESLQDLDPASKPANSDDNVVGKPKSAAGTQVLEAATGSICFEDIMMIAERFFILTIQQDEVTGTVEVRVQEAGLCEVFTATLPGRDFRAGEDQASSSSRQLRVFAQSYDFFNLNLLLAVEDIPMPPGLVVRIARGDPVRPHAWHDPEQRVYWLSRAGVDDGRLGVGVQIDGPGTVISEVPARHREQLLDFVRSKHKGRQLAPADELAGKTDEEEPKEIMGRLSPPKALANNSSWVPEYGAEIEREGVVLFDTSSYKPVRTAAASAVESHLMDASVKAGGRPLLKIGRRLQTPGGSTLCVLTVREYTEPHVHFTVGAYEIGKCRYWTTLVDSVDVFRALQMRTSLSGHNAAARRALAREIVSNCKIAEGDGEGGLRLVLAAPTMLSRISRAITTDKADQTPGADVHELAAQALSQEDAVRYMADPRRFCLLRAPRTLGGLPFDIRIYDEPDAPDAAFLINNLLVIASDTTRGIFFTHRLNDKSMQHPLLPEEQHLVEPENRTALLKRIVESIDLCTSVGQHGSVGDRLVMQSFRIDTLPPLVPDKDGTLVPSMPSGPTDVGLPSVKEEVPTKTADQGETIAGEPAAASAASIERLDAAETTPLVETPAGSLAVLYIGGCALAEKDSSSSETAVATTVLATSRETLGDAEVELTLRTDPGVSVHVFSFRMVGEMGVGPEKGFEVQIPAGGDPTRAYLEYRVFEGTQLIVSIRQQAFPHEVQATVFDIKSHEQLTIVARDDAILPLIERSARERLSDLVEQLVKFGSLGTTGCPELYRPVASGREIFPSDFITRALQRHVPVVSINFGQLAHEVPSEMVTSRDLLYSCSRYVISPDLVSDGTVPEGVDLDAAPLLRLSLSKKTYCQDFTFSIENARDGSGGESHMLHIRDKLTARPLGVYAEIQKLGDLRLHILFMDDFLPRALRIAVFEPMSGWSFQLIILDASAPVTPSKAGQTGQSQDPQPFLVASPPRHTLLNLFRTQLSVRKGLPSVPMLTNQQVPSELVRPASHQAQGRDASRDKRVEKCLVLLRLTRFAPNKGVLLYTVIRELDPQNASFFLRATVSRASSAKEASLVLATASLDRVLLACGANPTSELSVEDFDSMPDSSRKQVAEKFLELLEVAPTLEITLRLDLLPKVPSQADTLAISSKNLEAHEDGQTTAGPPMLECSEERLLGRIDRMWATVEQLIPDGATASPPAPAATDSEDQPEATLRVEVFDGSDCVEALFHSTNLRLRVTDLAIGRVATRDVHEEELEPWLAAANATHLLSASRESDLIDMVLWHTSLAEPGKSPTASGVVLLKLSPDDVLTNNRYSASFLQSAEAKARASMSDTAADAGKLSGAPAGNVTRRQ